MLKLRQAWSGLEAEYLSGLWQHAKYLILKNSVNGGGG